MTREVLTLYSFWRSSASYRVRIALELKSVRYRLQPVHLTHDGGAQYAPAYLSLNPEARVPTLIAGTRSITQSVAILEWLEETYPRPSLLPADSFGRARVRSLVQLFVSDVQPLQNLSVRRYLRDRCGADESAVGEWVAHWVERGLAAAERHLANGPAGAYCHGDTPTFADVCLVPQCYAAELFGVALDAYPRLRAIAATCRAHAAFIAAHPEAQPDAEHSARPG